MEADFICETELPGRKINNDTLQIIAHRYYWSSRLVSGKVALEVGCGPGLGMGWLSCHCKYVVGGDITKESLMLAKKHYGSRVELVCMDAHRLPIRNNCLDVVISLAAIIYMDFPVFIEECRRVLKPGGMLIVNTPNKDVPGFRPSPLSRKYYSVPELFSLLEEHGFDTKLFGAFRRQNVLRGNQPKFLRVAKKVIGMVLKSIGLHEVIKRAIGLETLSITLKQELGEGEMRLVEDVEVVALCGDSAETEYRIIYGIAKAK